VAELVGAFTVGMIEKRELLLFDRFATITTNLWEFPGEEPAELPPAVIPHQWLLDRGLLSTFDDDFEQSLGGEAVKIAMAEWREHGDRFFAQHEGQPVAS
jgi:hypothetical protein